MRKLRAMGWRKWMIAALVVGNIAAAGAFASRAEATVPASFSCGRDCHCFNEDPNPGNICSSLGSWKACSEQTDCTNPI